MAILSKATLFIIIIVLVNLFAIPDPEEEKNRVFLEFEIIPEAPYQPAVNLDGSIKWIQKK